mgnify:FL=1
MCVKVLGKSPGRKKPRNRGGFVRNPEREACGCSGMRHIARGGSRTAKNEQEVPNVANTGKRVSITLACTECKQRNYNTKKNKQNDPDRLEMKKYCRFCRKHTLHRETK